MAQTLTYSGQGQYDFPYTRRLVWDDASGLGVLVVDEFGGQDRLEGGAYRPYLYTLSTAMVATAIAAWDEPATDDNGWVRGWERWWYDHAEQLRGNRYYGDPEAALDRHVAHTLRMYWDA